MSQSWVNFFTNPRGQYLKKAMFEVLQERYSQNEEVIDRLSVALMTENDMNRFLKLMADVYEIAYTKAVNDHKEQLAKAGLIAHIAKPTK